ncbi:MAG: threonine synthase [Defluviitaleaceae bacterium]|nr:threonine synthase [Defluviitaleaceae bacterium]MCL2263546.1 threonine synthase [Defluviitaleaceae bacterium]
MKYFSTRGDKTAFTAAQTIVKGIADDGGLYVPEKIPVAGKTPAELSEFNYNTHATWLIEHFLTDFNYAEVVCCVNNAYNANNFTAPNIAPLHHTPQVSFLELFHGRTLAFKDMALSILPHFMQTALQKTENPKTQIILTATSGDTGVSALEGFKDIEGTKIIVFYPENGVSVIQKQHMITQTGGNVHVVGVKGNFDDAQSEVKRLFLDAKLNAKLNENGCEFSSANSINTGRLIPQIIYYFHAYSQLVKGGMAEDTPVNFVVPTGNFGNILAGYYAKKMGLPINKLICASNENKVLYDYFETGEFDSARPFHLTSSPSMDILIPSNFERLVYSLSDGNVIEKLNCLSSKQKFEMPVPQDFVGFYATEAETRAAIKKVFGAHGYLIDPHTAVAYAAYEKYAHPDEKTVIVSTASPYKFPKTVMSAVDAKYENHDDFALLEQMAELTKQKVPAQFEGLNTKPILHNKVVSINEMESAVLEII